MLDKVNNFTAIESVYGKFVVNRHCEYHAEFLIKTGRPHIQSELNKILTIVGSLPEQCVVVDAGANIGLVSVPIAREILGRGGSVYAFEVQRMLCYALCGTTALDDLENLHVHNRALGSSIGMLKAGKPDYGTPQDFGMFSLLNQHDPQATEDVPVTTIDALPLPRLDFFKVDVEGMEIEVLRGARETIRKCKPWCWIEYWKQDVNSIKEQFQGLHYEFFTMDHLNLLCAPRERLKDSSLAISALHDPEQHPLIVERALGRDLLASRSEWSLVPICVPQRIPPPLAGKGRIFSQSFGKEGLQLCRPVLYA